MSNAPENRPDTSWPAMLDKAALYLRGFGMRVFVHLAGFAAAFAVGMSASVPSSLTATAAACAYTGVICLVARGMARTPLWLVPAAAGAAQAVFLLIFGFPLHQALFWGGVQTWLQRAWAKQLRMGSEWLALLLILPLSIRLLDGMTPLSVLLPSFAAFAVAGRLVLRVITRRLAGSGPVILGKDPLDTIAPHKISIASLRAKNAHLPQDVRKTVEGIALAANNILECMAADPRDLETGNRFLKRYLAAVHTVADKHARMSREQVITPEVIEALSKSGDMLARLESAFNKEHAHLLQNDATDLSAELNVLDTLLKMDGR